MKIVNLWVVASIFFNASSFDWEFYRKYNNLNFIDAFHPALYHFIGYGINNRLRSTAKQIKNTNFDWKYYIKTNNLSDISNEKEAFIHYNVIGKNNKLEYCKKFEILFLLHLYDLDLMDEYIERINNFIKSNNLNKYYIKINVPIGENINGYANAVNESKIDIKEFSPYHSYLINSNNQNKLEHIYWHLINNINLAKDKIQIMFSENRGLDVGSLFLFMDAIKKENLKVDFLIKIHTKKSIPGWREILTSFLNIKINRLLNKYDCIYSSKLTYPDYAFDENIYSLSNLLNYFKYPVIESFDFCAGTMFIVSSKFLEFIRNWNFIYLFTQLRLGFRKDQGIEHAYERLFGYIFEKLKLKTLCLDYYYPNYPIYLDV